MASNAIPPQLLLGLAYQSGNPLALKMQFGDLNVNVLTFTRRGTVSGRFMKVRSGAILRPNNRVVILRQGEPWSAGEIQTLSSGSIRERLLTDSFRRGTLTLSAQRLEDFPGYQTITSITNTWAFEPLEYQDIFLTEFKKRIGPIDETIFGPVGETRCYHFVLANDLRRRELAGQSFAHA